jgi:hypothetical protein
VLFVGSVASSFSSPLWLGGWWRWFSYYLCLVCAHGRNGNLFTGGIYYALSRYVGFIWRIYPTSQSTFVSRLSLVPPS